MRKRGLCCTDSRGGWAQWIGPSPQGHLRVGLRCLADSGCWCLSRGCSLQDRLPISIPVSGLGPKPLQGGAHLLWSVSPPGPIADPAGIRLRCLRRGRLALRRSLTSEPPCLLSPWPRLPLAGLRRRSACPQRARTLGTWASLGPPSSTWKDGPVPNPCHRVGTPKPRRG